MLVLTNPRPSHLRQIHVDCLNPFCNKNLYPTLKTITYATDINNNINIGFINDFTISGFQLYIYQDPKNIGITRLFLCSSNTTMNFSAQDYDFIYLKNCTNSNIPIYLGGINARHQDNTHPHIDIIFNECVNNDFKIGGILERNECIQLSMVSLFFFVFYS
jgi:hypothetical protein